MLLPAGLAGILGVLGRPDYTPHPQIDRYGASLTIMAHTIGTNRSAGPRASITSSSRSWLPTEVRVPAPVGQAAGPYIYALPRFG
jgi:hypothetical protein